jgi:RecB family exonuclease
MSKQYLRKQYRFDPHASKPFKLSRSKVDLFVTCPRCFYLDRKLGLRRPGRMSFNLNNAVDTLMKREFDHYRESRTAHPIMNQNGVDAIPYVHDEMERWREPLHGGLQYLHPETNLLLTGAPDDLWVNPKGELSVVDYKATRVLSQASLDDGAHPHYERQLEFYSWLLVKMGFEVSHKSYFVVAETKLNRTAFNNALEFDLQLLRHESDWDWIEPILIDIKTCLMSDELPDASPDCDYCNYVGAYEYLESTPKQVSLL